MKTKPIIIVAGEPYSVFLEIFFKSFKKKLLKNFKSPVILICSEKLLFKQMKRLNYNFKINKVSENNISAVKSNKNINVINVDFKFQKPFDKISKKSNDYIENSCSLALKIIKKYNLKILINGPISKKYFLRNKYPGMTEYFADKSRKKNQEVMLIYGKKLAVSPLTTHYPLKKVSKLITKKKLIKHAMKINEFYKSYLKRKPKIAITGLNPHCETNDKFSEEEKILIPAVKNLKIKKINISGPYPADTIFMEKNYQKFDLIIGMYHDQVLAPMKTIYEFKAINITIGLPFIRITPDHGPNHHMLGKNKSSPDSLIEIINFIKSISAN